MSAYLEKTIAQLIPGQFPAFYRDEGEVFVEFVTTYFRWLQSVTEARANTWISEGVSSLAIESGNTQIVGTNTRLENYFSANSRIAISRGSSNAYDVYTVNAVSNNTHLTITTEPNFSSANCRFAQVAETGNPVFMTRHFDEIQDIDDTFENFLVYFKEKYLKNLQFINVTNTRRLVKHSLDLYRSKGTERSIELLFRIAFGITPSVYYPSSDLFRLSDGTWYVPMYLEMSLNDNTTSFVNKQIYGMKSGATAFAESVIRRAVNGKLIDVVYISEINGTFETGEPVNTSDNSLEPTQAPIIVGSLTRVLFESNEMGSNFEIGDEVTLTSIKGIGAKARVQATTNTAGTISFDFINGGYGYTNAFTLEISDHIVTLANVVITNADTQYFYPYDVLTQPLGHINYISANTEFANGAEIFTYHANNDQKGHGRVLESFPSNTTAGFLVVSILDGNLESDQFFLTSNAGVANQATLEGFVDKTAIGSILGVDDTIVVSFENANGSFFDGDILYQYNDLGNVTGSGRLRNFTTTVSGHLYLDDTTGVFHTSAPILNSSNSTGANVTSTSVRVGVKVTSSNTFVNTGINYAFGSNSTSNGTITLVPDGSGASVVLSTNLSYTETINVGTDLIADFLSVDLNASQYGLSGDPSGNLTNMPIAQALGWEEHTIGKLTGIISQSQGSGYGDRIMVRVYDDVTRPYQLDDTYILTISNLTTDFELGEYVTQSATGARGIIRSQTDTSLTIERLTFHEVNTWIATINSTTFIVGDSSGASANIDNVVLVSPQADNLGENAIIDTGVNISTGAISELQIIDAGFGYVNNEEVQIRAANGLVMQGYASLLTHGFSQGFYLDRGGFLSEDKKLFDGTYWQNFCIDENALVLKSDLRWVPAHELKNGDELIGFPENLKGKIKLQPSTVIRNNIIEAKKYRITTDKGTTIVSEKHMFVKHNKQRKKEQGKYRLTSEWILARDLKLGDYIKFACEPWKERTDYEAGWMAGILDGEGWCCAASHNAGFAQNQNIILEKGISLLENENIKFCHSHTNNCHVITASGMWNSLRMLGIFRPVRLLPKSYDLWNGSNIGNRRVG